MKRANIESEENEDNNIAETTGANFSPIKPRCSLTAQLIEDG